jgi:DNA-binding beta-propeller fold protein YncE
MSRRGALGRYSWFAATIVASAFLSAAWANADATLYYSDIFNPDPSFGSVNRVATDGSGLTSLVDTGGGLRGLDVDPAGGKIYWADVNNFVIRRANLDGTGQEDLITGGLEFPMNVSVDPAANKLYWGDISAGYIGMSDLDGSNPRVLLPVAFHWGLAIDKLHGKLYWSTSDTIFKGRIQRANLDGTGLETVVSAPLQPEFKPASVAVDPVGGKIYWTDYVVDVVRRSNLDGSNIEELFVVGANFNPRGIALDLAAGKVYWGQDSEFSGPNGTIMRMNLDGSSPQVAVPDIGLAQDIVVVQSAPPCPADLSGDGVIGQADLGILLSDYGCTTPPGGCRADITGDGTTDQADLGVLLAVYGTDC